MSNNSNGKQPDRAAELRYMAPLYQRLSKRIDLLAMLESECGLRRVSPDDTSIMTNAALTSLCEILLANGEHHTGAWLSAQADAGAAEGIVYYLRSHRTLRSALFEMIRLRPLWLPEARISIEVNGEVMRIGIHPSRAPVQAIEHGWGEGSLTWLLKVLSYCVGKKLIVRQARVMTPVSPAPEQLEELIGFPVTFGAPDYSFDLVLSELDQHLPGGNDRIRRATRASIYLSAQRCRSQGVTHFNVLGWLRSLDSLTGVSLDTAALALNTSGAALRKKLASEGTRFGELLKAFRREQAFEQLVVRGVRPDSCAMNLGYVNRAALERAFKNWFEDTPAQMRRQLAQLAGPCHAHDWYSPVSLTRHLPAATTIDHHPVLQAYVVGLANKAWYGGKAVYDAHSAIANEHCAEFVENLALLVGAHATKEQSEAASRWWHLTHRQAELMGRWLASANAPFDHSVRMTNAAKWYEIGVLPLLNRGSKIYEPGKPAVPRSEALAHERNQIGMDRHGAGGLLLSAWMLPPDIIALVRSGQAPGTPEEWLLAASAECAHAGSPQTASTMQRRAIKAQLHAAGLSEQQREVWFQHWAQLFSS